MLEAPRCHVACALLANLAQHEKNFNQNNIGCVIAQKQATMLQRFAQQYIKKPSTFRGFASTSHVFAKKKPTSSNDSTVVTPTTMQQQQQPEIESKEALKNIFDSIDYKKALEEFSSVQQEQRSFLARALDEAELDENERDEYFSQMEQAFLKNNEWEKAAAGGGDGDMNSQQISNILSSMMSDEIRKLDALPANKREKYLQELQQNTNLADAEKFAKAIGLDKFNFGISDAELAKFARTLAKILYPILTIRNTDGQRCNQSNK